MLSESCPQLPTCTASPRREIAEARCEQSDWDSSSPLQSKKSRPRTFGAPKEGVWLGPAALPATAKIANSPLGLVDAKPSIAHDDGSDHTDDCQRGDELTTLLLTTKLLQPPSASEAATTLWQSAVGRMSAAAAVTWWVRDQ